MPPGRARLRCGGRRSVVPAWSPSTGTSRGRGRGTVERVSSLMRRFEKQAQVQRGRRVSERADGDEVDAGRGDLGRGRERDAAGRLELGSFGPPSLAAASRAATAERSPEIVMLSRRRRSAPASSAAWTSSVFADLDLDRHAGLRIARPADRLGDAAGQRGVVLLDQDRVVKAHAVIVGAARRDRRLLEHAKAGGRLAGVEDLGAARTAPPRRTARSASPRRRDARGS